MHEQSPEHRFKLGDQKSLYLPKSAQSFLHLQNIKSCKPFPPNRKLGFILTLGFAQVVKELPETNMHAKVARSD